MNRIPPPLLLIALSDDVPSVKVPVDWAVTTLLLWPRRSPLIAMVI